MSTSPEKPEGLPELTLRLVAALAKTAPHVVNDNHCWGPDPACCAPTQSTECAGKIALMRRAQDVAYDTKPPLGADPANEHDAVTRLLQTVNTETSFAWYALGSVAMRDRASRALAECRRLLGVEARP